ALMEGDFTSPVDSYPACKLHADLYRWITAVFERGGVGLNMGMRLPQVFAAVGLPSPELQVCYAIIGSGDDFIQKFADFAYQTLHSLRPKILEYGIATEEEPALESFKSRYVEHFKGHSSIVRGYLGVSAWSRKA